MTASHSSWPIQRTLRALLEWPALLIRMSTRPSVLIAHSTRARPCSGRETSLSRATALPPALAISVATTSRGARRRPDSTTCAPSAASMCAVERPMPVPAPVTMAICPASFAIRLLSPCPYGLFEVIHARGAAVAHHLAHLVNEGGGGCVDEGAQDGELDHRPIALGNADEARHIGGVQSLQGDLVHARDLRGIRGERPGSGRPEDDRSDHEAGARRIVVEDAEDGLLVEAEPQLLMQLAQGRRVRALPRVDAAAGERPLPGVSAQGGRALGKEEAAAPFLVGEKDQRHRRGLPSVHLEGSPFEGGEVLARPGKQRLVEAHD